LLNTFCSNRHHIILFILCILMKYHFVIQLAHYSVMKAPFTFHNVNCNMVSKAILWFLLLLSSSFIILFFPSISLQWLIATILISCILPIIPELSWCLINNKYSLRIVLLFVICFFSYFYIEKFVGVSVIAGDMGLMANRCRTLVFEADCLWSFRIYVCTCFEF
jgi:hypothetical protein